ncbi:MAG: SanA/YdcF family protein [Stenotrophobium sp.]
MRPSRKRRFRNWLAGGFFLFALLVLLSNRWVINSTNSYLFTDEALLPSNDVGLVLGTSPYTSNGKSSPEFYGRVRAAAELYKVGKIKSIIVSGANPDSTYNEPRAMFRELTRVGVPASAITMDFAGFRTLDSIQRAQVVFGLNQFTIITTRYHAWRALFLARKLNLQVVAYAAPIDSNGELGARNPVREIFARSLAVLDVLFLGTEPQASGAPQNIKLDSDAEGT